MQQQLPRLLLISFFRATTPIRRPFVRKQNSCRTISTATATSISSKFQPKYKTAPTRTMSTTASTIVYPVARRDESISDDFHGTVVADPYRWLEDPDAPETAAFVDAQNAISKPYLELPAVRQQLSDKVTALWNYPKYSAPARRGNNYFHYANSGLQNQSVLYKQVGSLEAEPSVFLDPNTLSADGTIALSNTAFSDDGQYFAYGLSESGSDWNKIKVKNVDTGADYPECLERIKFSGIAWTKDNKGFFYSRFPDQDGKADGSETAPNENQKLYYHRLGESQDQDVMVVEFPDTPKFLISGEVSDCGRYLVISTSKGCRDNLLYFADLQAAGDIRGKLDITQVVFELTSDFEYVTNTGPLAVFRTNRDAPNYRLIVIDFNSPQREWQTLIAEHATDVLVYVTCVHQDRLIIEYIHDVKSVLVVHSLSSGELLRQLPLDIGSVAGFSGDKKYSEIFFVFMSYLTPGTIYRYDFAEPDAEPTVYREIELRLEGFNRANYQVDQVFYASRDGTKVPMFLIQKRRECAAEAREPRPCMLYGYGGFNISIQPSFSVTGLVFADTFNGVVAYPNIRGGGEYGERWHNGGRLLNKQNVFDDFQAAAEYLVAERYTEASKIVIQGGSNGGLLVAACINQRPDLFGAAVAQVGVMDMLRFHKFTIGHSWTSDYGSADEVQHFANLYRYSPLHNVKAPKNAAEQYPSTLVLTADHDDRVSPLHSLKYMAALHEAVRNSEHQVNPLLLRVYNKAGHGAGKPTAKKIEEVTDMLVFMYEALRIGENKN